MQQPSHRMQKAARLVTAEEFAHWPDDDSRYELVRGRVVRMSPVGARHGQVAGQLVFLLKSRAPKRFGVTGPEVGMVLARNPDTVLAPDVAFVRADRMPAGVPRGFFAGAPDLAVEILSPGDRPSEVRDKVADYLRYGTSVVLVVDPDGNTVTVARQHQPPGVLDRMDAVLDLDDVIPRFRCTLAEIFEA